MIRKLKSLLTRWEKNLTPFKPTENPNHFVDLTPKVDLEKSRSYREALKWALENNDVYNIALTGPYGSGKSSILKALQQTNTEYEYLKISLASFQDETEPQSELSSDPENDEKKVVEEKPKPAIKSVEEPPKKPTSEKKSERLKEKERQELHRLIELSILQQIFYRVTDDKLPQSRFKRIKKLSFSKLWKAPLFAMAWAASVYFLYSKDFRTELYTWKSMTFSMEAWFFIVSFIICTAGIFYLLVQFSKLLFNAKFSKLNVLGGGLELNYSIEKSILNKHLDEILYFFEETKFNVVIIEDLDRFNDVHIFTKLRELNLLINNADQVVRPIKFIYAIKDDIFTDGDRTKFFDFIVPVLPVINYSNALDQFLPKIEAAGLEKEIPKKFLYDITLYINDMRILSNVFNEFMLYKENLKISRNLDKLMAMVVYKNIEPKDFSELHSHRGIIQRVMDLKPDFISHLSKKLTADIKTVEKKLEPILAESAKSIKELRAAYIQEFIEMAEFDVIAIHLGERVSLKNLTTDDNFDKFKKLIGVTYYYLKPNFVVTTTNTSTSFAAIEKRVNKYSYDFREQFLVARKNGEREKLEKELNDLNGQLNLLKTRSYKTLLTTNKTEISYFEEDFKTNELLVYLVRGGYIDELYERYMSYFYEKSLKTTDMDFLKHVRNLEPQAFDYSLTNIEELLYRLEAEDFQSEELLNFTLLDYLFKNEAKYKPHLKVLFNQLGNDSKQSLSFTAEFLARRKHEKLYIYRLAKVWPGMWSHIVTDGRYTPTQLKTILNYLIEQSEIKTLDSLNHDGLLLQSINVSEDLLTAISAPEFQEKLAAVVEHFPAQFSALSSDQVSSPVFELIYEHGYYEINPHMISLMIDAKGTKFFSEDELKQSNYTAVLASGADKLIEYIAEYINTYVDEVFLTMESNTNESEQTVVLLLKNTNLDDDQKEKIIQKQESKISNIRSVDILYWDLLLENNKLLASWDNISGYLNNSTVITEKLAAFLNNAENYKILSKQIIIKTQYITEQIAIALALTLIKSVEISEESFAFILKSIPFKYDGQSVLSVFPAKRIEPMIASGNIPLSVYNFDQLKEHHEPTHISLIVKSPTSYLKNHAAYTLTEVDNLVLMKSRLSENTKLKIAEFISNDQLRSNSQLAEEAGRRMIRNGHQFRSFEKISALASHGSTNTNKLMTAMHISDFTLEEGKQLLIALGDKYETIPERKKNQTFDTSDENKILLKALKEKKLIVDFRPYKDKLKVYHTEEKIKR